MGCVSLPSRCGYPDATNTGAKGALTVVQGDVVLSTAGMVYSNKEVRGCIKVTAANVTIRNVKVSCPRKYEWGIEYNGQGGGRMLVEDTTISLVLGSSGIGNNNFTARRVNVYGGENGFMIYDGHALLEDNYCHDLTDESIHPEAHTDCVEGNMIYDTTIRHNSWLPSAPGAWATSAQGGACGLCNPSTVRTGWLIENNLLDGGYSSIYCLRVPSQGTQVGSIVRNNRFGPNHLAPWGNPPDAFSDSCAAAGLSWTGNVRDDTGALIPAV